jgi:hypothetical protein
MRWKLMSAAWRYRLPATGPGPRLRARPDSATPPVRPAGRETVDNLSDHQLRDIGLSRDANGRVGALRPAETD